MFTRSTCQRPLASESKFRQCIPGGLSGNGSAKLKPAPRRGGRRKHRQRNRGEQPDGHSTSIGVRLTTEPRSAPAKGARRPGRAAGGIVLLLLGEGRVDRHHDEVEVGPHALPGAGGGDHVGLRVPVRRYRPSEVSGRRRIGQARIRTPSPGGAETRPFQFCALPLVRCRQRALAGARRLKKNAAPYGPLQRGRYSPPNQS